MLSLTWPQVHAWRLSQHCLSSRLERPHLLTAVTRTGGIQAQVMSAAELAIGARVNGLSPQDVQGALWEERTLVKTWAMRGTLHLLTAEELALYAAANSVVEDTFGLKYFTYYGLTPDHYTAFISAVPQVLSSEPMTREELAAALAKHMKLPELGKILTQSSWGTPFKPSAFRGDLCFGPNQGRNITFVRPDEWTGAWRTHEPYAAFQEIARRYLQAYGPARPETFVRWWWGGTGIVQARKLFDSLAGELEEVEVEGWQGLALSSTVSDMAAQETAGTVHLLPLFDAYTLILGKDLGPVIPDEHLGRVFRPQGWISAVILENGRVRGVWEYKARSSRTTLSLHPFTTPSSSLKRGVKAEAERLGKFFNTNIELKWQPA